MNIIYLLLFIIFYSSISYGDLQKRILVKGNTYIDDEVIYSIIGEDINLNNDSDKNIIIKSLYDTGNFQNIEIEEKENYFVINIIENPKVNKVIFQGNERFKSEEILELFKDDDFFIFYNVNNLDRFIDEFKKLYYSFGYNQINIEYNVRNNLDNKDLVDLDFNISEGKISTVNKIYFVGNNNFDKNELISEIKSKENNFFLIFRNSNFKKYQVNNDVIRLSKFYKNNGYRDVEINYKTEYLSSKNRFNIYFYIVEGLVYNFAKFNVDTQIIDINESQNEQIQNIVDNYYSEKIIKKNYYNLSNINKLKDILSDYLYEIGLIFFDIQILEKNDDANIDVLYRIVDSQPQYINEINIYGNTRTLDEVIRREMDVGEGDAVNSEKINKSNRNLSRLGIFKSVSIDEIPKENNIIDLDVNVEEKSTGEFQVGLSFGSYEGATLVTGLKEKNFGGTGRHLDFSINTSRDSTLYLFDITEPYILNKKLSFIYGINYAEEDFSTSASYELSKFNTQTGFNYLLSEDLNHKITLEYSLKNYNITNSSTASTEIKDLSGGNANIYLNNKFTFDKLNSFIRPTKGVYFAYTNSISPSTNSNNGSIKNTIIHKKYIKFDTNVFSIQTKIGNIFSLQNSAIPSDEKFSLGGRWLRGFDSFGAGPRNSRTSYVGGNNIIVSKFDLQRPIFKNSDNPIDLNIFLDAGKIFDNKNTPSNSTESIRSSYGLGIKLYTPIGPIGFSWAFPIASETYDIEKMFIFSIGNIN